MEMKNDWVTGDTSDFIIYFILTSFLIIKQSKIIFTDLGGFAE